MTITERRGVAVVTGGSAGVGRAVVRRLAEEGFDVGILARGDAGLAGAAEDVRTQGRRPLTEAVDVADAVDAAASRVEAELGPIDVWVNNAMTTVFAWSWDVEPEEYRRATEVTYLGQVYGTLAALRRMRPRNRASKFATRGFSESVRAELLHQGSDVTLSMSTSQPWTPRSSTGPRPASPTTLSPSPPSTARRSQPDTSSMPLSTGGGRRCSAPGTS